MNFLMPDDKAVRSIFGTLFGDDTKVAAAAANDAVSDWVAIYVGADDSPVAACTCNQEFVAYAGSALTMLPAAAAKSAAASGKMDEMLVESLREIMNISSRLLMSDHTPHLRLGPVTRRAEAQRLAEIATVATRKDFQITIPRYGAGQITCLVT